MYISLQMLYTYISYPLSTILSKNPRQYEFNSYYVVAVGITQVSLAYCIKIRYNNI